jgi:predicted phage baseplate assembly protein
VEVLFGRRSEERVYRLDAQAGQVQFGDGQHGQRVPEGARIRVAEYRHGGGAAGNLPAGELRAVNGASGLSLRHELATTGGRDGESVAEAERRIPGFLTHRNRAVTHDDFATLALTNPLRPVGRAEVIEGLLPGSAISNLRRDVPGVVSLFVLPPGEPELGHTPRPTQGLLKDVFAHSSSGCWWAPSSMSCRPSLSPWPRGCG